MLMDNKGGSSAAVSGGLGENAGFLGAPENLSGAVENFETDLNREQMSETPGDNLTDMNELPTDNVEMAPSGEEEAETEKMPDIPETEEKPESAALTRFKLIGVPRNTETIPKATVSAFAGILKANEDDPSRLAEEYDAARWDFIEKDFGRKKGDGLNGTGETVA